MHRDVTEPWAQVIAIRLGRSFEVGGFRDGSGHLADNATTIKVTGPDGFSASPANLAQIKPPAIGTYNVRVTCGGLSETATVTVNPPQ